VWWSRSVTPVEFIGYGKTLVRFPYPMGECSVARPAAKKSAGTSGKGNAIVRYFREVRAEIRRVTWPSRKVGTRLSVIVMAVTVLGSVGMGLVDWLFTKIFALIMG